MKRGIASVAVCAAVTLAGTGVAASAESGTPVCQATTVDVTLGTGTAKMWGLP